MIERYGPTGRTKESCMHSMQDWYVKNDKELGCSDCDDEVKYREKQKKQKKQESKMAIWYNWLTRRPHKSE